MNKLFKTLPFALGLLTLASCSEDVELTAEQAAKEYDGLIVKVAELTDGSSMRAAFVENGPVTSRAVAWKKGDQVKVYGMYNWRTQLYDYDADATKEFTKRTNAEPFAAFKLNEESREKDQDLREEGVGYALYPSKLGYFDDEDRTKMVFKLDEEFDYSVAGVDDYMELADIYTDAKAYSCPIPMWGYADGNQLTFEYLTGFIRVSLEGMEATEENKLVVVASKPLNGTFEATAFNYDGDKQVPELAAVVGEDWEESAFDEDFELEKYAEENSTHIITVKIPEDVSGDNAIYVPIPAGDYKSLQVIYAGETLKWKDNDYTKENVTEEKVTILRGKFLTAEYRSETDGKLDLNDVKEANQMLTSIHDLIECYGTKGGREQVVTITNTGSSAVEVGVAGTHVPGLYTLDLSDITLTNDLKIKVGEGVKFSAMENATEAALQIKGAKGAKTITIEFEGTLSVPVTLVDGTSNIVLAGGQTTEQTPTAKIQKALNITTTGTLTIGGMFGDDVTASASAVNVNATTFAENKGLVAENATVNVNDAVTGNINAATINVISTETTTASVTGTLNATTAANITNAKVGSVETTTGTITINNVEAESTLEMEIEEVKLLGAATVNLNNGFVKKITNENAEGEATKVTIVSKGKSAIGNVTNVADATITSYWDGETHTGASKANDAYYGYNVASNVHNIYTATQLAWMSGNRVKNLYANIYLNEATTNYTWDGKDIGTQGFNGNDHTIYNVKLSETAKGFFNSTNPTNRNYAIKDLTINGISAEGTLDGVGALVGSIEGDETYTTTISNVKIQNATLTGDKDSHDVGGLIGKVTGKAVVENTNVSATIEGCYNLAAIVGSIAKNAEVEIKSGKIESGCSLTVSAQATVTTENAGKVALVVGSIAEQGTLKVDDTGFKTAITSASLKNTIDSNWHYNAHFQLASDGTPKIVYFRGGKALYNSKLVAQYWVGYSSDEANYSKKYDGDDDYQEQTVGTHFNVFE